MAAGLNDAAGAAVHAVELRPSGWRFEARADTPLLRAAREAGIRLPSSCRNGTCRACMCMLVSGEVRYAVQWPGVTREEREEGWVLPCVAHAESDVVLEVPDAERRDDAPAAPRTMLTGAQR